MHRSALSRFGALIALMMMLPGCGASENAAVDSATATGSREPIAAEDASREDWHSLALGSRNLNAIARSPLHASIRVKPQQELDLSAKTASSLQPLLSQLPRPLGLPAEPDVRRVSDFTADDLIQDASNFDQTKPFFAMTAVAGESQATFNCATNPSIPQIAGAAWATYRYQFLNYDVASQPQSVGLLWTDDDAPSRYYIGLADWNANRWQWFEGDNDNVVTVADLQAFIRPDFVLLACVMVLDNEPRQLEFIQIGAIETRGLGGLPPESAEGQDFTTPEIYFPGKATSAFDGAPAEFILPLDHLGQPYDQGSQLSCTACAVAGAQNFELNTNYAPYWHYWDPAMRTSPKWIYRNTGLGQCLTGRPPEVAMDYLKSTGGATCLNAPFNTNCNNDWYAQASNDAVKLKIDGYTKIRSKGETGIDEIKYALHEWGRPVIFLITIDQALKDSSLDSFADGAVWSWNDWVPNIIYWHTMLIVGWDDAKQAFKVRNSWGEEWGDGGNFYVSYATFSSSAWIDCFVLWDDWNASTAAYFSVNDSSFANVPANFWAEKGESLNKVALTWDAVSFADEYLIYRDSKDNLIATVPAGTTSYDDTGISDQYLHTYWIRSVVGQATSPYGVPQFGYLLVPPAPRIDAIYRPTDCKVNESISLRSSIYNPYGVALNFNWDFPDGTVAGPDPAGDRHVDVTFTSAGTQTCKLTVDNGTDTAELTFDINVLPLPQHPVAAFSGPAKGKKSKVLFFDASGSSCDAGQSVVEYYWDWDGNGGYDESGTSTLYGHIFPTYGTFNVQLKVRDSRGLYSDWTVNPIEITAYDEVEDNDASDAANVISMLPLTSYRGSVGTRSGYVGTDGDGFDWWKLPAEPGNSWIRVDYNTSQIDQIMLTVWDDAFSFSQSDNDLDFNGRAETIYPPFAISTIYVQVKADSGGGDYTISWEHP